MFVAWRVGKAHFWPAYDRHDCGRNCATHALVLRNRPISLGCAFFCFHGCRIPARRLQHSIQEKVALARHCTSRWQSRGSDVWLFQRTRPSTVVCDRITLLCDHKAAFPWRRRDMAGLRSHVGTTFSVQSITFWCADKAPLGGFVHQA